ncbi:DUF45 domain-containing protein [Candidatus Poribacteria bacterium]|nr:DUF45 domain-containing protein [Candidatus Poribacteria bacterium]
MNEEIRIIRSKRRKKTISARFVDGAMEVLAPASISDKELQPVIEKLKKRLEKREKKRHLNDSDELEKRSNMLNQRYFNGELKINSIKYVTNQDKRLGSCTSGMGTIRISHKVAKLPKWVADYILIHEMAHLIEPNHSKSFWKLVNRYPLTERARGYIMALKNHDQ